jgi:hypothetical protein
MCDFTEGLTRKWRVACSILLLGNVVDPARVWVGDLRSGARFLPKAATGRGRIEFAGRPSMRRRAAGAGPRLYTRHPSHLRPPLRGRGKGRRFRESHAWDTGVIFVPSILNSPASHHLVVRAANCPGVTIQFEPRRENSRIVATRTLSRNGVRESGLLPAHLKVQNLLRPVKVSQSKSDLY